MWKIKLFSICLIIMSLLMITRPLAMAQDKVFTAEELSQFDGKDGQPAYFAYKGQVYDVTKSMSWKLGQHFGLQAGQDLTGKMGDAPHGDEVLAGFPVVGTYESLVTVEPTEPLVTEKVDPIPNKPLQNKWYSGRIRIIGISILGWTGIIMGVFFVLTFATCFELPWGKMSVPWRGKRPGSDALDGAARHLPLTSLHKYFVWWAVAFGLVHGVLGFLQLLGIYL